MYHVEEQEVSMAHGGRVHLPMVPLWSVSNASNTTLTSFGVTDSRSESSFSSMRAQANSLMSREPFLSPSQAAKV